MSVDVQINTKNLVQVGLSWDPNETMSVYDSAPAPHDLDLSCAILNADGKVVDLLSPPYPKRDQYAQAIFHGGDNLSGGSDFEDEYIRLNFDKMAAEIAALAFVVSTKNNLKFQDANKPEFDIRDEIDNAYLYQLDLKSVEFEFKSPAPNVALVGMVVRDGSGWGVKNAQSVLPTLSEAAIEEAVQGILA